MKYIKSLCVLTIVAFLFFWGNAAYASPNVIDPLLPDEMTAVSYTPLKASMVFNEKIVSSEKTFGVPYKRNVGSTFTFIGDVCLDCMPRW